MQIQKVSWSAKNGIVTFYGRLGEIDAVLEDRLAHTSQGPRKHPESKPYYVTVLYSWGELDELVISDVYVKSTNRSRKSYCFYERESREGEVVVNSKLPFKQYYLESDGSAITKLAELINRLENHHSLRNLIRSGPDSLPEIEPDDEALEDCDLAALREDREDLAETNLEA